MTIARARLVEPSVTPAATMVAAERQESESEGRLARARPTCQYAPGRSHWRLGVDRCARFDAAGRSVNPNTFRKRINT